MPLQQVSNLQYNKLPNLKNNTELPQQETDRSRSRKGTAKNEKCFQKKKKHQKLLCLDNGSLPKKHFCAKCLQAHLIQPILVNKTVPAYTENSMGSFSKTSHNVSSCQHPRKDQKWRHCQGWFAQCTWFSVVQEPAFFQVQKITYIHRHGSKE